MKIHEKSWWRFICLAGFTFTFAFASRPANAQTADHFPKDAPRYQYDSTWPKPLPNKWTYESITGLFVDKDDHIWAYQAATSFSKDTTMNFASLNPPAGACCVQPLSVLEFDVEGNLIQGWGGPGYAPGWAEPEHTIVVDREGNVWLGGSAPGDTLLKFTHDGKFLADFGHRGPKMPDSTPFSAQKLDNQQTDLLLRGVASADLDEDAHELYIGDGYLNKRVIVYNSDTGAFKRGWGAFGIPLSEIDNDQPPPHNPAGPPAKQFHEVHCVHISRDGLVYVCDRHEDRVQVFTKQGKFLKNFPVANEALGNGSAGSLSFSSDAQQKYLYVTDMMDGVVWILNRGDGAVVGKFGFPGYQGGALHMVHVIATDSHGNVYTGEVGSAPRIQKFVPVK
jgi:hypothetical protein